MRAAGVLLGLVFALPALAADVVLFNNASYVNYSPGNSDFEASNTEAAFERLGHSVSLVSGTAANDIETALAGKPTFVIPSLAVNASPSLLDTLNGSGASISITDFVSNGGTLVMIGDPAFRARDLLNGLFGFSLSAGVSQSEYTRSVSQSAGTEFQGTVATLPSQATTRSLSASSLPAGARAIYANGNNVAVFQTSFGSGKVIYLGWNWFNAAPTGTLNGNWHFALNAAVNENSSTPFVKSAILIDQDVVDYAFSTSISAEGQNEMAAIQSLGGVARPIFDASADFAEVLAGVSALVFPEFERTSGTGALDAMGAANQQIVRDFVRSGGTLVGHATGTTTSSNPNLVAMNQIFGLTLEQATSFGSGDNATLQAAASGTPFAFGPASVPGNNGSYPLTVASLPSDALSIYQIDTRAAVAIIPQSQGNVVYLAWDWFDGAPLGSQNSGWLSLLDRALQVAGTPAAADVDGDGKSDLVWRNGVTGSNAFWKMNGFLRDNVYATSGGLVSNTLWEIVGVGDLGGDRTADVLWRNAATGGNALWQMKEPFSAGDPLDADFLPGVSDTAWKVAGIGDFDGDGDGDILWRHESDGRNAIWMMDGAVREDGRLINRIPNLNWFVAGVGDFDKDGKADILWRNSLSGDNAIWKMNGFTRVTIRSVNGALVASSDWIVGGVADFNADGFSDVLWRNEADGRVAIWRFTGITGSGISTGAFLPSVAPIWKIAGTGDYDGDRFAEIFWRNTGTGVNALWTTDGSTRTSITFPPPVPDQNWQTAP